MAERMILVCDVCRQPAQESVTIRVGAKGYAKDLCGTHLEEILSGTRTPKRGRRPGGALTKPAEAAAPSRAKGASTGRRRTAKRSVARA